MTLASRIVEFRGNANVAFSESVNGCSIVATSPTDGEVFSYSNSMYESENSSEWKSPETITVCS